MKGTLNEVIRAMEEATNVPWKRSEEIMLLSKTWRKAPAPPGPPQQKH